MCFHQRSGGRKPSPTTVTFFPQMQALIDIDSLLGDVGFKYTLTRDILESRVADAVARFPQTIDRALAAAKCDKASISDALLIGGGSRVPCISDALRAVSDYNSFFFVLLTTLHCFAYFCPST